MTLKDVYEYVEEYIGRSKKDGQVETGKNSKHKARKRQPKEGKYEQLFGPVLFATILLFVVGGVALAFIPCKSGYRIVQYRLYCIVFTVPQLSYIVL